MTCMRYMAEAAQQNQTLSLRISEGLRKRLAAGGQIEYWFRATDNGITFGFTREEWKTLADLFRKAWEMPEVQMAWDALSWEYGEL